jgi:NTP pyrophosphatase (non-canonical NTP hydrolase)
MKYLKIIKDDNEYQEYLKYIESVFHKELSEDEANDIEVISLLVEDYEKSKQLEITPTEDIQSIDYIYDLVCKVSPLEKSNNISNKGLKLNEEVGELSAEILKLIKYKYHNDTEEQIRQNLLEEAADSIIQVFDILADLKYTKEELIEASEKKIDKWLNQINK